MLIQKIKSGQNNKSPLYLNFKERLSISGQFNSEGCSTPWQGLHKTALLNVPCGDDIFDQIYLFFSLTHCLEKATK